MSTSRNPFEVLGVSTEATVEEVKEAYRFLCKELHPDTHPGEDHTMQLLMVQDAYKKALIIAAQPKMCPMCRGAKRVEIKKGFSVLRMVCGACGGTGERR
jgi:DnaJ-class molecular chaperone